MESIFNEKNLVVCDVPVPQGYPQSQTHAGVALHNGRLYLTTSPYPQIHYTRFVGHLRGLLSRISGGKLPIQHGDVEENPMLYWGEMGVEAPIKFTPYIGNPIVSLPPALFGYPAFNSDPDIYIENDDIYIINREYIRRIPSDAKHFVGDSRIRLDMVHFKATENGAEYQGSRIFKESDENILSPCLTKWAEKYRLVYLDTFSYLYPETECHLFMESADEVDGKYGEKKEIKIESKEFMPWHLSIFWYKDQLYSIVACVKKGQPKRLYQMLGKFDESMNSINIYQKPLIDFPSYRGAAYVTEHGDFILYSTTDKYPLKGSKAVDGKDVIMGLMPFEKLLKEMENAVA